MFLKSIYLENVACFNILEMSFDREDGSHRKWTVLLGENGYGKSVLLRSIALVTVGSEALANLLTAPADWIKHGETFCQITAILTMPEGDERSVTLRIERGDTQQDVIARNSLSLAFLDNADGTNNRDFFVAGYGVARRVNSSSSQRSATSAFPESRARSVATLFAPSAPLAPLEAWFIERENGDSTANNKAIEDALNDLLPGISFQGIDRQRGATIFDTPDGLAPLRSLSDGYQTMAAWLGDLLYRTGHTFNDLDSPLDASGILLIDAVDLHTHPAWQQHLLSSLDKHLPDFQLVVTTQSPITAQQAGPGELHYLSRRDGQLKIEQFDADPRKLLLSQLLLTDAFGLESDESYKVQQTKALYAELRDRSARSSDDDGELQRLVDELAEIPSGGRTNLTLQQDQADLLRDILDDLKTRRS